MPKAKSEKAEMCTGGRSMSCRHDEHPKSKKQPDIYCQHCRARMGCFLCVVTPRELVCLNCHDWAHPAGLRAHGKMIPRSEAGKAMDGLMDEVPFRVRDTVYRPIISQTREPGDDDN